MYRRVCVLGLDPFRTQHSLCMTQDTHLMSWKWNRVSTPFRLVSETVGIRTHPYMEWKPNPKIRDVCV